MWVWWHVIETYNWDQSFIGYAVINTTNIPNIFLLCIIIDIIHTSSQIRWRTRNGDELEVFKWWTFNWQMWRQGLSVSENSDTLREHLLCKREIYMYCVVKSLSPCLVYHSNLKFSSQFLSFLKKFFIFSKKSIKITIET